MNRLRHALASGGWAVAIVLALVVALLFWQLSLPSPVDLAQKDTPPPPVHDAESGRGPDLIRGAETGATPNKAYPRPVDRGFKYSFIESPNWSGRGMNPPEAIVVHVFGSGTCAGVKSWFQNPAAQVSAHFAVCKNGEIVQFVEIGDAAWHAGIVNRPDMSSPRINYWINNGINPNLRTVGIEVDLKPGEKVGDYPEMVRAYDDLLLWVLQTLELPANRANVLGHFELDSVNRAVDPICCIWLEGSVEYAASRLAPVQPPAALTIEERLRRIEERLGID